MDALTIILSICVGVAIFVGVLVVFRREWFIKRERISETFSSATLDQALLVPFGNQRKRDLIDEIKQLPNNMTSVRLNQQKPLIAPNECFLDPTPYASVAGDAERTLIYIPPGFYDKRLELLKQVQQLEHEKNDITIELVSLKERMSAIRKDKSLELKENIEDVRQARRGIPAVILKGQPKDTKEGDDHYG